MRYVMRYVTVVQVTLTGAALSLSAAPRFSSARGFSSASSAGLPRFSCAGDLGAAGDLQARRAQQWVPG
jgi:hypothetical protein